MLKSSLNMPKFRWMQKRKMIFMVANILLLVFNGCILGIYKKHEFPLNAVNQLWMKSCMSKSPRINLRHIEHNLFTTKANNFFQPDTNAILLCIVYSKVKQRKTVEMTFNLFCNTHSWNTKITLGQDGKCWNVNILFHILVPFWHWLLDIDNWLKSHISFHHSRNV